MAEPTVFSVPDRTWGDFFKDYWQYLAAVALAAWTVFNWWNAQQQQANTLKLETERLAQVRAFEARKPFLEKQLGLHFETTQIVGKLVTLDPQSEIWKTAHDRYWALHYSELAMVTDDTVSSHLREFGFRLNTFAAKQTTENRELLRKQATQLAYAIRGAVDENWSKRAIFIWSDMLTPLKTLMEVQTKRERN